MAISSVIKSQSSASLINRSAPILTRLNNLRFPVTMVAKPQDETRKIFGSLIQAKDETRVHRAVRTAFGGRKIENPALLTGGRGTSIVLKFTVDGKERVMRITDETRPHFVIDPASEIRSMKQAHQTGVTPALRYAEENTGILIYDYVPSVRLTGEMLQSSKLHAQLGGQLRKLHSGSPFVKQFDLFHEMEKTAEAGNYRRMPLAALELLAEARKLKPVLSKHLISVPSHNELNSNNLLFDPKQRKFYFIDWEFAGNSDPFIDLAIVSKFLIFDPANEEAFLSSYFPSGITPKQRAQFTLIKQLCYTFYAYKHLRRLTGTMGENLSHVQLNLTAPASYNYGEHMLSTFNGNTQPFTKECFEKNAMLCLREAMVRLQSPQYKKSVELLSS